LETHRVDDHRARLQTFDARDAGPSGETALMKIPDYVRLPEIEALLDA